MLASREADERSQDAQIWFLCASTLRSTQARLETAVNPIVKEAISKGCTVCEKDYCRFLNDTAVTDRIIETQY